MTTDGGTALALALARLPTTRLDAAALAPVATRRWRGPSV